MAGQERIEQPRLEKLSRIINRGINPYPYKFHRTHTAAEAVGLFEDSTPPIEVSLAGRITAARFMGKAAFFDIRDGSGKIQAFFRRDSLGNEKYELLHDIDLGDFIGVKGILFKTRSGEITVETVDYSILAKSLMPLPEKFHGLVDVEKRYRQRYLDLISNEDIKDLFIKRSKIISTIRNYMTGRGFLEVETPVLQPMYGGALARPFITHHHALDQDLYPRIALELYLKRLIIGGFDKVYEIGRVFRNEGISTKHNPEFTMMESYEAYADYHDVMQMTEELISATAREVLGTTEIQFGEDTINLAPPWKRLPLKQALIEKCGVNFMDYHDADSLRARMEEMGMQVDPLKDRGRLIDELLSTYVEPDLKQPTFLIDYPIEMSPLAKRHRDDPALVERFEAFIGTMEVANSFSELNDPREQRERFTQQRQMHAAEVERAVAAGELPETEMIDDDFITAMEHGMPPTGGLGIGIDRLVMLLTNKQSIREVILFPQLKTR
ncbi:MAG: lysine--tRNA ligase [Dehalococcoidia bacterium]|nr:lysine--tRNA ligase [Dehalococcoidia bacterium]